jgi:hypothetical protein
MDTNDGMKRVDGHANIEMKHMGERGVIQTETYGGTRRVSN